METASEHLCQWNPCDALPSTHVGLGFRHIESVDGPCGRAVITTADHYDLCEPHVEIVRTQYHTVSEYEIGKCPECDVEKSAV